MTTATGTVIAVKADKGFAFIEPDAPAGADDIFLHRDQWVDSSLEFDMRLLWARVTYDVETDWRGRLRACRVRINSAVGSPPGNHGTANSDRA